MSGLTRTSDHISEVVVPRVAARRKPLLETGRTGVQRCRQVPVLCLQFFIQIVDSVYMVPRLGDSVLTAINMLLHKVQTSYVSHGYHGTWIGWRQT